MPDIQQPISLSLAFAEQLDSVTRAELEQLVAALQQQVTITTPTPTPLNLTSAQLQHKLTRG